MSNTKSFVITMIVTIIFYFLIGGIFQYFVGKPPEEIVAEFLQNIF